MALRRCWRIAGVVPRLLLHSNVLPVTCASRRALPSHSRSTDTTTTGFFLRNFSSSPTTTDVTYDQLKQLLAGRMAVVIDVREPWELREYGSIPGAVNVPLGQVNVALQLDPEEFKEKYGGDMPEQTDNIVFSCLAGIRSKKALDSATSLGYKDVQHYPGGWQEWAKNEQLN
ncbi:thiosulfate sulfurtransferase/rhodanese-like domain-containing protein 3 [Polymixia lowei]